MNRRGFLALIIGALSPKPKVDFACGGPLPNHALYLVGQDSASIFASAVDRSMWANYKTIVERRYFQPEGFPL